jgi:hypothetical protein
MEVIKAPQFKINDGVLRLNPPVEIILRASVLKTIKQNYLPDGESGGLLWLKPYRDNTSLIIDNISVVPNISQSNSTYLPQPVLLANAYQSIFESGYMPMFYHTHPTTLGHSLYDHKRPNFYLKSSVPDRQAARNPVQFKDIQILLPEGIAVGGDNYEGGIDIVFYEGGILPAAWNRLSTTQIVVTVVGILVVLIGFNSRYKKQTLIFALLVLVFIVNEERKRPIYTELPNGDTLITINKAFL